MSYKTHIQWADSTWNVVTGCNKVSLGCVNCYAERHWARLSGNKATKYHGRKFFNVRCHPEELRTPLRWKNPRRIIVPSMGDLFDPDVPFDFIASVFGVMAAASHHVFQVLTKRPMQLHAWMNWISDARRIVPHHPGSDTARLYAIWQAWKAGIDFDSHTILPALRGDWVPHAYGPWPLPNVWFGVSCEDQATADERIPILIDTPAAHRFVSAEPLLEEIDLRSHGLDWVIVGGESGPKARPCELAWIRSIVEHCEDAGIPVFVKQVHLNGKLSTNPDEWPEDVRVTENPE